MLTYVIKEIIILKNTDTIQSNAYLLRIAGVNIYNSIKDTEQLSVYRGASLLLKQAIKDFSDKSSSFNIDKTEIISTGASEGLFIISITNSATVSEVIKAIKNWLSKDNYQHFTFVVDCIKYDGDFKQANEKLIAKSRFSQMRQFSVGLPEWNTSLKNTKRVVCPEDRVRVADQKKTSECPGENEYCSKSVSLRYSYGKKQKRNFVKSEILSEQLEGDGNGNKEELEFCNTLEEIARDFDGDQTKGNLANKIAVIYFDGNGFGSLQAECKDKVKLKKFDQDMQNKRQIFLTAFIDEIRSDPDFKNGNKIRLEILLWGGDEMTFVVPAWKGLEVVQFFYEQTNKWKTLDTQDSMTHCGGVVFSQPTTSIHKLHDLARELADKVKEVDENTQSKKENSKIGRKNNWFDYLVLESIDYPTQSLTTFWQQYYGEQASQERPPVKLANRDYTELYRLKKNLPKTQLYALISNKLNRSSDDDQKQSIKRLKSLVKENATFSWDEINIMLNKSFYPELQDKTLFKDWAWIHFLELWDYIPDTKEEI